MIKFQPTLLQLFLNFLRLGVTAFGGPSMVAYIRKLAVEKKAWLNPTEFSEGVAFCQMVPGATAMQAAAYVGFRLRGVAGAAVCYIGFGLPAFVLMMAFAIFYAQTGSVPVVSAAFSGLQAVVVAIVANAAFSFGKTTIKIWRHVCIMAAAAGLFWLNINPLFVILLAGAAGWLFLPAPGPAESKPVQTIPSPFPKKSLLTILACVGVGLTALYFFSGDLFRLALLMFRVDLMAFGGGFASVPIMFHEVVEVNHWLDGNTFMNGIVLGQITPGPVVITATFIGYSMYGWLGAVVATFSIFLPSFLLVIGLSPFFNRLSAAPVFHKIIRGVLCSFVGLLISVALRFAFQIQWDVIHILLAAGALTALLRKIDILWVVLAGTLVSILLIR